MESTIRHEGSFWTRIADVDYRMKRKGKPVPLEGCPSAKGTEQACLLS
jgi:hypothetical protein